MLIRGSVLIFLILRITITFLSDFERDRAPAEIVEALENVNSTEFSFLRLQFLLFAVGLIALNYVSCVVLLIRYNWGKYTFAASVILLHCLHPLLGYHFITPWTAMLESLNMVLSGFIIGLTFYASESYFRSTNTPNKSFKSVDA